MARTYILRAVLSICFLNGIYSDSPPSNLKDPAHHRNWKLADHKTCGIANGADRIIGGKDADLGEFPWIARIGYINSQTTQEALFRCGAVLATRRYVISAAHCVTNLPYNLKVGIIRLGEHNTLTDPDCEDNLCAGPVQDYKPMQIIVHKKYGKPAFKNDISLIRLDRDVNFTDFIKPICFIHGPLMTKNFVGQMSQVAGWGIFDIENPTASVILQKISLPIVENENCKNSFKHHADIGPTQMCVGGTVGQDSCGGDSGGPLMKLEADEYGPRFFLLGVVSFGAKRCGATTMPGVYTRISYYMEWILDNMEP